MTVLITGARGFIGRHVARHFADNGHKVVGLGHGAWLESVRGQWGVAEWQNGEISSANLDALSALVGVPDIVIHLAGGSAVGPSFAQPAEDFHRSVVAASELAEWLRLRAPTARLVMASSAAVYGAGHSGPIAETAPSTPYSPYGFHKRMAELALESHARNFGLRVAIVRLFSVYGPGLRKQLLWDACTRLVQGETQLKLGGTGDELRDWLHVDDVARLMLWAAERASNTAEVINGGTGVATPVREIARRLCTAWGSGCAAEFSGQARPGDPVRLVADVSKVCAAGFTPTREWGAGLDDYVAWFRAQHAAAVQEEAR
ncbi:NAD-dependent epimerase/dehydratase family protein [Roseateles sp. P5_E1]